MLIFNLIVFNFIQFYSIQHRMTFYISIGRCPLIVMIGKTTPMILSNAIKHNTLFNLFQVDSDRDEKNKRLINQDGPGKSYCIPNSRQRRRSSSLANNNNFNGSNNNSLANSPVGANGRNDVPTRSNSETKPADSNYISVSGSMSWDKKKPVIIVKSQNQIFK